MLIHGEDRLRLLARITSLLHQFMANVRRCLAAVSVFLLIVPYADMFEK